MKTIWYVKDLSLKTWLEMYSGLKEMYYSNKTCEECGGERGALPFVKGDSVGLELSDCPCGKRGSWIMTPRSKEGQKKAREDFYKIMDNLLNPAQ